MFPRLVRLHANRWQYGDARAVGLSSNRHQAVYLVASICEHYVRQWSNESCEAFQVRRTLLERQNITFHELNPRKCENQYSDVCRRVIGDPSTTFGTGQAILTSDLLQSSCPGLLRPITRTPCRNLTTSPSACPGWPKLHVKSNDCGRHLGLRVRPGDQPTVFPVDESNISTTEEGEAGPQRAKRACSSISSKFAELFTVNFIPGVQTVRQRQILLQCSEAFEGEKSAKTAWTVARGQLYITWQQFTPFTELS